MHKCRRWIRVGIVALLLAGGEAHAEPRLDTHPDALHAALTAAVIAGDQARLDGLTRDFHAAIVRHFGPWLAMHAGLEGDARRESERTLEAVAASVEVRGDRTLRGMLSGVAANNRARGWARTLRDAAALARDGRCPAALDRLAPLAVEMQGWHGDAVGVIATGIDDIEGGCALDAGDHERALAATYRAYERAVASNDRGAIARFGLRMVDAYRVVEDRARALDWAQGTAGVLRSLGRNAEAETLLRSFGVEADIAED